jgi:hypothetical protein
MGCKPGTCSCRETLRTMEANRRERKRIAIRGFAEIESSASPQMHPAPSLRYARLLRAGPRVRFVCRPSSSRVALFGDGKEALPGQPWSTLRRGPDCAPHAGAFQKTRNRVCGEMAVLGKWAWMWEI